MSQLDAVLQLFCQEGSEKLEALDEVLLRIETAPESRDLLDHALRVAHNFKGAAGTAGLERAAALAHELEDVLQALRSGQMAPAPEVFDALFAAVKALRSDVALVASGQPEAEEIEAVAEALSLWVPGDARRTQHGNGSEPALGEYDLIKIRALRRRGLKILRFELALDEGEADPATWASAILGSLGTHTQLVATFPPEGELQRLAETRCFTVVVGCEDARSVSACVARALGSGRLVSCTELSGTSQLKRAEAAGGERPLSGNVLKVNVERVDALVDMIGELVIVQSMVTNDPEIAGLGGRRTRSYLGQLTRITREIQDLGLRMRMVPVHGVFQAMARLARDLARKSDKLVRVDLAGGGTEMDRSMVERIHDPLLHLVRNAVDHGLEAVQERRRLGKSDEGQLRLSAQHQGGSVVIELSDDGRGLDRAAIASRARASGLWREGTLGADALGVIFEPGFTTSETVTEVSGRGVGLDVVRRAVEAMRGQVTVSSEPGTGTCFRMILPLTLAIIEGMLVRCGHECYVIPTLAVVQSLRPRPGMLLSMANRHELLNVRGELIPLLRLGRVFDVDGAEKDPGNALVVVIENLGRKVGLMVDEVMAQQQVVIKSIGDGIGEARLLSGAAILPNGNVALIVNVDEICSAVRAASPQSATAPISTAAELAADSMAVGV